MITYFLGEKHLYSFSISKNNVNLLRGDVVKKLVDQTNLLRKNLEERNEVEVYSKNLYLFLISQQINPSKKDLVIIADNILSYIPFEILQKEENSYLLEDYTISYSWSARIFLELENRFYQYQSPNQWAGFSPNYLNENVLSSTSDEIEEIANLMDGTKFVREASTKENFLKNNHKFSVLHLAMHAEINRNNSAYNKLIFADGDLTSSEIYTSNNKANLVVLSACNTGSGKLEKGEGIMSMARAFHFSGIPAVVMSLWEVPDFETKTIMIDFYKYLKKGKSKSEALRLSKLDYLKSNSDKQLRHPYFWSGFVISGNTDPLILKQGSNYILWLGMLLFASVLAVVLLKRVK
jgi:CHAT domain-containing protein